MNNVIDGSEKLLGTITDKSISLTKDKTASFSITVTLPADLTTGENYFLANVDSDNAIAESNETNNVGATTTTLTVQ